MGKNSKNEEFQANCKWLSNRKNISRDCKKDKVAKACPDTCKDKCNGQDFRCKNVKGPTPSPTANPCGDCSTESPFPYKNSDNEEKQGNCKWLSNLASKSNVCENNEVARHGCPDTCQDKCNGQDFRCNNAKGPTPSPTANPCGDCSTGSTFKMKNSKNEEFQANCKWLSNRKNISRDCKKDKVAKACPDTCKDKCNGQDFKCVNVKGPTPSPTANPCGDCSTESPFQYKNSKNKQKEGNCKWLSKQKEMTKLCRNNEVARTACPDTCHDKCNGQDFRCKNVKGPTPSPTANPCGDCSTESP